MVNISLNTGNISGGDKYISRQDFMDAFNSTETLLENVLNGIQQFDGIKVGNGAIDASAMLQLDSSSKGGLIPRMTTTQRDAIGTPAIGLTIFNTTQGLFNTYDGVGWVAIPVGALLDDIAALTGMTKGDLLVYDGANFVRVPVGTDGQEIHANSSELSGVKWEASAGPLNLRLEQLSSLNVLDNTLTEVPWDSEDYDTNSIHDTVTNIEDVVIDTAGKYLVCFRVWQQTGTGAKRLHIRVNGADVVYQSNKDDSVVFGAQISWCGELAVNDVVTALVYQNTGVTKSYTGTEQAYMIVRKVG